MRATSWIELERIEVELREVYRIKRATDYAIVFKYGKVHVMCQEVYSDSIKEVFDKHLISIDTLLTFP